jgi:hypothetical protein
MSSDVLITNAGVATIQANAVAELIRLETMLSALTGITTGNLTSITATGTITSGTWNGTAIGAQYGGTGI